MSDPSVEGPAPERPAVRVIVVTYSPGHLLDGLLDSLPKACTTPYEVVIADNGSTDGAPERAAREHGVRIVRTSTNVGYGAAANVGAQGRRPSSCWCATQIWCSRPALWMSSSRRRNAGQEEARSGQRSSSQMAPSTRAPERFPSWVMGSDTRCSSECGRGIHGPGPTDERMWPLSERAAGWLSGSCLLLRRRAFDAVGGFDPGFFMYFEDVDLGDRLGRSGWQNVYVPDARVTHVGGTTTSREPRRMLKAHHESAYRYLAKRYRPPLRWLLKAGLQIRYVVLRARTGRDRT